MGSGAHSGPEGPQGGKKVPKMVWIWSGLGSFSAPFWYLGAPFRESFFDAFSEGVFFGLWAIFGCPRWPKGLQNGAKMDAKASLGAPSGKCKNHGRGCVFSISGGFGEGPGGDFFQTGPPDLLWRGLGVHFLRF